jgi:hypothetical protein
MECTEFHGVFDRRISGQDANGEVLADILDPTTLADRLEPKRDRFIEAFGSDFGAVFDSFCIADGDAAATDRCQAVEIYAPSDTTDELTG